jgi:uncharacterized protein (DUF4415 family)
VDLVWDTANIIEDIRKDYPEQRFTATAYLKNRLHVICFTPAPGGIRVISFRKANMREVKNMSSLPLTDDKGEVRELTTEDFKHIRPATEVLPKELLAVLPKRGRSPKSNLKKSTTIRLNAEVMDFFKAHGKGWQTKINDILQKYVDSHHAS